MPKRIRALTGDKAHDAECIREAADVLRSGGLVAFPTETVYGLGANALDADAVARIYEAKGRPARNPLIVHVSSVEQAKSLSSAWPTIADALAKIFWPGPLTLILPKASAVPDIVTGGGPTVAIRFPSHPVARALLTASGIPIAAPSANRSGMLSATTAQHVIAGFDAEQDLFILDGGATENGIESTVLDLSGDVPLLRRPGPIGRAELTAVLGASLVVSDHDAGGTLASPGMMTSHYAPKTTLVLISRGQMQVAADALRVHGKNVGILTLMADPEAYAAQLYAMLHRLDAQELDVILVEEPPQEPQWEAVRDRLTRAAADRPGAEH